MTDEPPGDAANEPGRSRFPVRRSFGVGVLLLGAGLAYLLLGGTGVGYPIGAGADPLLEMEPAAFERATTAHAAELRRLDRSLADLLDEVEERAILDVDGVDDLTPDRRRLVRAAWIAFLDHFVALDALKQRYRVWPGVSYPKHPRLHARAYGIAYGALLSQCRHGLRLLRLLDGSPDLETVLDEPVPEMGLPEGTLGQIEFHLVHVRTYSAVRAGRRWWSTWMEGPLEGDGTGEVLGGLVGEHGPAVESVLDERGVALLVENAADIVRDRVAEAWYPVQARLATWIGDARVGRDLEEGFATLDQIRTLLRPALRPGDILVVRKNWKLSNVGLPGFWPHAALYLGTPDEVSADLDDVPAVRAAYPGEGSFTGHLRRTRPEAWDAWARTDGAGDPMRILEGLSEGIVFQSLEHSARADYVGAVRPRLSPLARAQAIEEAVRYHGRPYDFDFDFRSDAALVCSELVYKAYQPAEGKEGLHLELREVLGRRVLTPTSIIRTLDRSMDDPDGELDFVFFLDGREREGVAVVAGPEALRRTPERPKWDILQP